MFHIVEKNQKVVKGILIVVAATFVMFGIGSYLGMGGDDGYVAKVGTAKIYSQDVDNAMQQQQGQQPDKMQVLFGLINRQLLINSFKDNHLSVSDAQLQKEIADIPAFQESGDFSLNKYQAFLQSRYLSATKFQDEISSQILLNQMIDLFKNATIDSKLFTNKLIELLSRKRSVAKYTIDPKEFYAKVNVTDKDINNYYQQSIAQFTLPEQVKLQYLVLSKDIVADSIKPTEEEIALYAKNNPTQANLEQVDASHILFSVANNADPKTKANVKAQAAKILAEVKANPKKFAALAKQYSQDPGSADKGGELGFFGKGVMAKSFESTAFSLKQGEISGLVETQFGFHIIKLNAIKMPSPEAIREFIISQIKQQQVTKLLQSKQEQLTELVYNKSNSLEPASAKLGLSIQTSDWVSKVGAQGDFANPKVQQAIFNDDLIKKKNNSEVIDLGNGKYAVYRLSDYRAAKVQTLAEVKDQIGATLKQQQASALAYQDGQNKLKQLQDGKLTLDFGGVEKVNLLAQSKDIDSMAVKQIFATNIKKLPAYTGAIGSTGSYVIYKITSEAIDNGLDKQNMTIANQLNQGNSMLILNAYVNGLRTDYKVSYISDRLNNKATDTQQ